MACGNRHIHDMISACVVWFTFVFRTPIPHAVEDFIVKGLSDSRGSCHLAGFCLASLIYILIISQGWGFVKRKSCYLTLSQRTRRLLSFRYSLSLRADKVFGSLSPARGIDYHQLPLLTPLLYHKSCDLSRAFLFFFGGGGGFEPPL